jgi:hypothetical protein
MNQKFAEGLEGLLNLQKVAKPILAQAMFWRLNRRNSTSCRFLCRERIVGLNSVVEFENMQETRSIWISISRIVGETNRPRVPKLLIEKSNDCEMNRLKYKKQE